MRGEIQNTLKKIKAGQAAGLVGVVTVCLEVEGNACYFFIGSLNDSRVPMDRRVASMHI